MLAKTCGENRHHRHVHPRPPDETRYGSMTDSDTLLPFLGERGLRAKPAIP